MSSVIILDRQKRKNILLPSRMSERYSDTEKMREKRLSVPQQRQVDHTSHQDEWCICAMGGNTKPDLDYNS